MLESLLFMALMIIGGATLILTIVIIGYGFYIKEKSLRNIGFAIGLVPTFCFGLIAYWYGIAIPSFNKNQMNDFSGTYLLTQSSKVIISNKFEFDQPLQLVLYSDGTYKFDKILGIKLDKNGTWETGGIDGHFYFYDNSGNLVDYGMPSGNKDNCSLSFHIQLNKNDLYEMESIYFNKVNF